LRGIARVLLLEPRETAWDLRWRMFGIPVRVHPMFWLVGLFMGMSAAKLGLQYVLIWVACVFASVLVHELGHVVMGMVFGQRGRIVLYAFGGLAIGSNQMTSRWQRIAVSFAGPLAGFLFLAIVLGVAWLRNPGFFSVYLGYFQACLGIPASQHNELREALATAVIPHPLEVDAVAQLIFINLLWGLVNLLPVWPLDGGQICRNVSEGISPENGLKISLGISLVTAGLLALHCIMSRFGRPLLPLPVGSLYTGLFFGMFALQSFQLLQQIQAQDRQRNDSWDYRD
jgi:stage IV sporulation protein FB